MKRLTERMLGGVVLPEIPMEIKNKEDLEKFHHARKIYEENTIELAAYEDTGLDPEELQRLVNQQKWHVMAYGDLPPKPECSMKKYFVSEIYGVDCSRVGVSEMYWDGDGFYSKIHGDKEQHVLAWRELPEPWEGE